MRWVRSHASFEKPTTMFKWALVIILIGNVALAIAKGFAAYLSNSSAILADAINSLSDVIYSLFLVAGLWLSQRPPDRSHPQGHSRFEPIVALIVTMTMSFAAYEAARSAIARFTGGAQELVIGFPLIILLIATATKIVMYFVILGAARNAKSPGLHAAAKDNLADVFTSIAAGVGVVGTRFIHPFFDPVAGLIVAAWILRSVIEMIKENLGYLTGAGATQELLDKFVSAVKRIDDVDGVHHVITEYVGPKLVVDMHINVDGLMSLDSAHAITDQAIEVLEAFPEVDRAYVHVEPIGHY